MLNLLDIVLKPLKWTTFGIDPLTVGAIAAPIIGGIFGRSAAGDAADAQERANQLGIEESRRQFNAILRLLAPQLGISNQALNVLGSAFIPGFEGINIPGTPGPSGIPTGGELGEAGLGNTLSRLVNRARAGTPEAAAGTQLQPIDAAGLSETFRNLPGTQFQIGESLDAIGNSFASRGGALGGNSLRAIGDRVSGLAADRTFGGLLQLAGFGPQAAGIGAQAGLSTGSNISSLLSNSGSARASGITGGFNSLAGGVSDALMNAIILDRTG